MAEDNELRWQDAIAELAHERTLAESGVALLKHYGSSAQVAHGFEQYSVAKAEYDAVIAGLIVTLSEGAEPADMETLVARMQRAEALRQEFSNDVNKTLPPPPPGARSLVAEAIAGAIKGAVGPLIDAVKAIWFRHLDDSQMRKKAIQTQLEATKWPAFDSVPALGAAPATAGTSTAA